MKSWKEHSGAESFTCYFLITLIEVARGLSKGQHHARRGHSFVSDEYRRNSMLRFLDH